MKIHVVVLQEDTNFHFDMKADRVPQSGELLVERNVVYKVKDLQAFIKDGIATTVLIVEHQEFDQDMYWHMNEMYNKIG